MLVLATSRKGLGIAGETTYRVPSLSLPDPKQAQTPESLSQYESVRLFIERAIQVQTTFALTNQNAPALASVCHRLDGIPLLASEDALRASLGAPLPSNQREQRDRTISTVRQALGDEEFETAWVAGEALTMEQAIEYALDITEDGGRSNPFSADK